MKKKKVIVTAVVFLATVTLATFPVYAKVTDIHFSGSAKTEFKVDEQDNSKYKTGIKLIMDAQADPKNKIQLGLHYESKTNDTERKESTKIEIENLWIENQLTKSMTLRLGSQSLGIGKGLWMDADGVQGAKLSCLLDKANAIEIFGGRDSQDDDDPAVHIRYFNWNCIVKQGNIGAYHAKQAKHKYVGGYGEYALSPLTTVSGEYVKNSYNHTNGYVAELEIGKLKKSGDYKTVLTYLDVDKELFANEDYTDYDDLYNHNGGFKGAGVSIYYKTSPAAYVMLQRYWGEKKTDGSGWLTSEVKYAIKF